MFNLLLRIIGTIITVLLLTAAVPSIAAEDVATGSRLTLVLDEVRYLVDQPIMTLVCVENAGETPFRDLAPLYPGDGYLKLTLVDKTSGEPLAASGIYREMVPTMEGITLEGGASQCEAVNLLDWFGRFSKESNALAKATWQHRLPPGSYRLKAELQAHTGFARNLPQEAFRSEWIEFEILPDDVSRGRDPFLDKFLEGAPSFKADPHAFRRHCGASLSQAYRSPYFVLFYYGSGVELPEANAEASIAELTRISGNHVRAAAVLWLHAASARAGDAERTRWLTRLRAKYRRGELAAKVVSTWEARLKQKKYSYSRGH